MILSCLASTVVLVYPEGVGSSLLGIEREPKADHWKGGRPGKWFGGNVVAVGMNVGDDCEEYKRKGERRRRLFRSEKNKRFERLRREI